MNAPQHAAAGIELCLRIGQRVRHRDFGGKRVTGLVRGLTVDSENALYADIALDDPIIIPALEAGENEIRLYSQHVPAHELTPFDDREELIQALLAALLAEQEWRDRESASAIDPEWDYERMVGDKRRAAISKATGSAA